MAGMAHPMQYQGAYAAGQRLDTERVETPVHLLLGDQISSVQSQQNSSSLNDTDQTTKAENYSKENDFAVV